MTILKTSPLAGAAMLSVVFAPNAVALTTHERITSQQPDDQGNTIQLVHTSRGNGVCDYRIEKIGPDPMRPESVIVTPLGGASIGCSR